MAKKEKSLADREHKQSKTGRPRKFEGPTQNFYITLPLEVVQQLRSLDEHLATAIVKLAAGEGWLPPEEQEEVLRGLLPVVIGVGQWAISMPLSSLDAVPGIRLIPYPPDRWLVAFEGDPRDVELNLHDYLAQQVGLPEEQRHWCQEVLQQLALSRRQGQTKGLTLLLYQALG